MFSHVQFSTRVIFGFAILLSNHVFCQPCRHFRVDIFLRDFHDFLHSHIRSCLSQTSLSHCSASTTSWNVATRAVVIFSLHRRFRRCDFEALAHCSCSDSHFSTYAFWHDSLLPVSRHLLTIDLTRATHCPVIAPVVNTVIILTIDRASSSGRHTRQRHMPVDRQQRPSRSLPPSALQPRLHGASASLQKTPSIITASSTIHAAHAFFQLRIIACSWAPFSPLLSHRPHQRPTLVFISRDSRTFPRTFIRQRY